MIHVAAAVGSPVVRCFLGSQDERLNQSADETHIPHAGDHVDLTWVSV